jgi:acetyl esterase/lipase
MSGIAAFQSDVVNASPIRRIGSGIPPFLITFCENDYPFLPAQAREFERALKAKGVPAELVYVPGKNHINEIVDVYQPDDPTARAMLQFIAQHR